MRMTAKHLAMAAVCVSALLAAGCTCGPRKTSAMTAEAAMRDDAVLMRLEQMQAEMDNRFAAVEYRIEQQSATPAPTVYSAPLPASVAVPGALDMSESVAVATPDYYPPPKMQIAEAWADYNNVETRRAAPRPRPAVSGGGKGTIRVGGVSVRDVQTALRDAGHNPGPIDGKLGARTKAAIREFQQSNGLAVDGIVGRRTWGMMQAYMPATGSGYANQPTIYK